MRCRARLDVGFGADRAAHDPDGDERDYETVNSQRRREHAQHNSRDSVRFSLVLDRPCDDDTQTASPKHPQGRLYPADASCAHAEHRVTL